MTDENIFKVSEKIDLYFETNIKIWISNFLCEPYNDVFDNADFNYEKYKFIHNNRLWFVQFEIYNRYFENENNSRWNNENCIDFNNYIEYLKNKLYINFNKLIKTLKPKHKEIMEYVIPFFEQNGL